MQKYGVGAFKKNNLAVQSGGKNDALRGITSETNEKGSSRIKSLCKCFASCMDSQQPASRSNKAKSQS